MATTPNLILPLPAALLAFAALASCGKDQNANAGGDANAGAAAQTAQAGQLFPDNFNGVCSGAPVANAAAYDPHAAPHKALYFATYRDDSSISRARCRAAGLSNGPRAATRSGPSISSSAPGARPRSR